MLFAQGWHFTPIISPRGEGWSHITNFTLPLFIEVLTGTKQGTWTVLYLQGRIQGGHRDFFKCAPSPPTWNSGSAPDLCVRGIDHLPLSIISTCSDSVVCFVFHFILPSAYFIKCLWIFSLCTYKFEWVSNVLNKIRNQITHIWLTKLFYLQQ